LLRKCKNNGIVIRDTGMWEENKAGKYLIINVICSCAAETAEIFGVSVFQGVACFTGFSIFVETA
jgi:hypothetical protein